ncbi:MAG TPA: TetR family transcriptional regulator [Candidatus Nanopelagicales bacterium]|jgi:AcrR family transcriptional regulator
MPKIIGGSLEEHRERMQERIFAALAALLEERGYGSITLADIAAAAGVARTAMYNYYADKETLLIAYTAHETGLYVSRLQEELATVPNPIDQLRVFVRMQLLQLVTQHVAPSSLSAALTGEGHTKMLEHVAPLRAILRAIMTDAIEQRYLPDEDLDLLLPLVTASIAGRSVADLDGELLENAIDTTSTFVLRGLGARLDSAGRPRHLPTTRHRAVG